MKKSFRLLVVTGACLAWSSAFSGEPCSIRVAVGLPDVPLASLAKLSRADAEAIAVSAVRPQTAATVADAELEVEHGCLIWSFDLRVKDAPGVEEVHVDAGNGQVLSRAHESSSKEADETHEDSSTAIKR